MKNPYSKLTEEQAKKQLKQFLIIGYSCAAIAFVALGFLSAVGIACGIRCYFLTKHKANLQHPKLIELRGGSIFLILFSTVEFILYWTQISNA